jgi:glutathione synthase
LLKKHKKIVLQIDPIESLDFDSDSTMLIANEFQQRGYEIFYFAPADLVWQNNSLYAQATAISLAQNNYTKLSQSSLISLQDFAVIFIRQIPPFNQQYLTTTHLLETLPNCYFMNHPEALRNVAEKLSILNFPEFIPQTIICHSLQQAQNFIKQKQICVAKSIYGCGGSEVIKIDSNNEQTIQDLTAMFAEHGFLMLQEYLPEVTKVGDKRVIIIAGKVIGAVQRMPRDGDFRANNVLGGTLHATKLTALEEKISAKIARYLNKKNILLAGIDLLNEKLIEINVTSPTCLVALNQLTKTNCEKDIVDHIEKKIKADILA